MPLKIIETDKRFSYYSCCQKLRRHGDIIQRTVGGYYLVQGRADDTMNLGGIKVITTPPSSCSVLFSKAITKSRAIKSVL